MLGGSVSIIFFIYQLWSLSELCRNSVWRQHTFNDLLTTPQVFSLKCLTHVAIDFSTVDIDLFNSNVAITFSQWYLDDKKWVEIIKKELPGRKYFLDNWLRYRLYKDGIKVVWRIQTTLQKFDAMYVTRNIFIKRLSLLLVTIVMAKNTHIC